MDTRNLITIRSFAESQKVTVGYIYQQIKANKLPCVEIDGVKFVDIKYLKEDLALQHHN